MRQAPKIFACSVTVSGRLISLRDVTRSTPWLFWKGISPLAFGLVNIPGRRLRGAAGGSPTC